MDEYYQIHGKWPIPEVILVYISFRVSATKKLFEEVGHELQKQGIENIKMIPIKRIGQWKVKDAFAEVDARAKFEIDAKNRKIQEYIGALKELGADTDSIMFLKHKTPYEHREYEGEEYDVQRGQYTFRCYGGTDLYKVLESSGILDVTHPLDTDKRGCIIL